jgi:hypothetical protein
VEWLSWTTKQNFLEAVWVAGVFDRSGTLAQLLHCITAEFARDRLATFLLGYRAAETKQSFNVNFKVVINQAWKFVQRVHAKSDRGTEPGQDGQSGRLTLRRHLLAVRACD